MNKNKIDLNTYLTRYGQQSSGDLNFNLSGSRMQRYPDRTNEHIQYISHSPEPQVFQTQMTHYSGFTKSQNQCIEQLQEIKRSLINEQRQLSTFLQNYSKKLYDNLLIEHNRIREQLLDMFDRVFSESEKRISDIIARENGNQPLQFISIRKRIAQVNGRIDELDVMLRGDNYRKAIAEVVTSDFEGEMRNVETWIINAQKNVLDNAVKLILDQNAFNRLRDDMQNLVITDASKRNISMHAQQPQMNMNIPPMGGERKPSRGRLGLFQTAPQSSGGGFFNFASG